MRLLFAVTVAMLVAFVATPAAHAGSLPRSMPRTLRGPEGMQRCTEAPISLAFDVVETEAARFAAPETLTSRSEGLGNPNLRTPARHADDAMPAAPTRVAAAPPVPPPVKKSGTHCGQSSTRVVVGCAVGHSQAPQPMLAPAGDDPLFFGSIAAFVKDAREGRSLSLVHATAPVTAEGGARDAHASTPWRPPCA
ncbi:MAG: hypothetical protein JNK05_16655 [Myxococcales bacterium]|nr:hypothetical protein [Myxococcales bacterium]